jgi:hypothetical protein
MSRIYQATVMAVPEFFGRRDCEEASPDVS